MMKAKSSVIVYKSITRMANRDVYLIETSSGEFIEISAIDLETKKYTLIPCKNKRGRVLSNSRLSGKVL